MLLIAKMRLVAMFFHSKTSNRTIAITLTFVHQCNTIRYSFLCTYCPAASAMAVGKYENNVA